jgi:hypothetical protein
VGKKAWSENVVPGRRFHISASARLGGVILSFLCQVSFVT